MSLSVVARYEWVQRIKTHTRTRSCRDCATFLAFIRTRITNKRSRIIWHVNVFNLNFDRNLSMYASCISLKSLFRSRLEEGRLHQAMQAFRKISGQWTGLKTDKRWKKPVTCTCRTLINAGGRALSRASRLDSSIGGEVFPSHWRVVFSEDLECKCNDSISNFTWISIKIKVNRGKPASTIWFSRRLAKGLSELSPRLDRSSLIVSR